MAKIRRKEKAKLLEQIAKDLETATRQAHSAAGSALNDAKAGRMDDCVQAMLEIEPRLYDAQKLFVMATYVNGLGQHERE